jgi:hypothetical protein
MKHLAYRVPYRKLQRQEPIILKLSETEYVKPWRPSPGLMPRLGVLAPNISKLPKRLRHYAGKLLAEAVAHGLNNERRTEIDKLIEEVKRPR